MKNTMTDNDDNSDEQQEGTFILSTSPLELEQRQKQQHESEKNELESSNNSNSNSNSHHSDSSSEEGGVGSRNGDIIEDDDDDVNDDDDPCPYHSNGEEDFMFTQHDDRGSFTSFGSDVGLLTQMGAMSGDDMDDSIQEGDGNEDDYDNGGGKFGFLKEERGNDDDDDGDTGGDIRIIDNDRTLKDLSVNVQEENMNIDRQKQSKDDLGEQSLHGVHKEDEDKNENESGPISLANHDETSNKFGSEKGHTEPISMHAMNFGGRVQVEMEKAHQKIDLMDYEHSTRGGCSADQIRNMTNTNVDKSTKVDNDDIYEDRQFDRLHGLKHENENGIGDTNNYCIENDDVEFEFTEETLIIEDSPSQSPSKMTPPDNDSSQPPTEVQLQAESAEWKGFTEEEEIDIGIERHTNENENENGIDVEEQTCIKLPSKNDDEHSGQMPLSAMQPGFTEDSEMEVGDDASDGNLDNKDKNLSATHRNQDSTCSMHLQVVDIDTSKEKNHRISNDHEFAKESIEIAGRSMHGSCSEFVQESGNADNGKDAKSLLPKTNEDCYEVNRPSLQDVISPLSKEGADVEKSKSEDSDRDLSLKKSNIIVEEDMDLNQTSIIEETITIQVGGDKKKGACAEQKNESQDQDYEIHNCLSIFTGDTEPIPSQFPLTLQDSKEWSQADRNQKDNGAIPNSNKKNESSKPLRCEAHSDYDSYYGGTTEILQMDTLPDPLKESSMQEKGFILGSTVFEKSTTNQEPEKATLSKQHLDDLSSAHPEAGTQGHAKESFLDHTPTHDMDLSYPNDYLGANNSAEIDKLRLSNKTSSGAGTLTITPHSQILLEPEPKKKPNFSTIDNVSIPQSSAQVDHVDDEINDSSDDENSVLSNRCQGQDSIVLERFAKIKRNDEPSYEPSKGNVDAKTCFVPTPTKDKEIPSGGEPIVDADFPGSESYLSPKRIKTTDDIEDDSSKSDNKKEILLNDFSHYLDSSQSTNNVGKVSGNELKRTIATSKSKGEWLKTRKSELKPKKERRVDKIQEQLASAIHHDSDTEGEDSIEGIQKSESTSCLNDTQPDDEDDDIPLIALRLRSGNRRISVCRTSLEEPSDEENEFMDDVDTRTVEPSQTTRDIQSQLQRFDNFDVKTLTEKLLCVQRSDDASTKKDMESLGRQNKGLRKKNKQLEQENESLRKELDATNAQLKEKNDLLMQMKKRLDEYQPLLEAVQKIGHSVNAKTRITTSQSKSGKKLSPTKRKSSPEKFSQRRRNNDDEQKIYRTPKGKASTDRSIGIVSVSNRKSKRKIRTRGNMTFNNLWKVLQSHGWKHKSGPEPYNQVYVPPNGSVRFGSKLGVNFFEANDLWKEAEGLGIIDSDDESTSAGENATGTSKANSSRRFSPTGERSNSKKKTKRRETVSPVLQDKDSDDDMCEIDNTILCGKSCTMTKESMNCCTSLIQKFLQLGKSAHFMRNLFGPIWQQIASHQGIFRKELGWKYCKSVQKGNGDLGREYWFCPPNSKGSKGIDGVDYFTTEETVVAHVLRELKANDNLERSKSNHDAIGDLEIKLSRALELHIPFDEIKNTSVANSKRSNRRKIDVNEITSLAKGTNQAQGRNDLKNGSLVQHVNTKQKNDRESTKTNQHENGVEKSSEQFLNYSQKTVQGAEILLQLNSTESQSLQEQDKYNNKVTKRGMKELLKFRRRAGTKRKVEEILDDNKPPRKKEKLSPGSMCHLTQVTENSGELSMHSPRTRSYKTSNHTKNLPLNGLIFFGSGVDKKVVVTVGSLGGKFLDDIGRYYQKNKIKMKLFFLSSVSKRRTHKYILACALGVPMLDVDWLFDLENEFDESKKKDGSRVPSAFDNRRYIKYRLPLGLSNESGMFQLQRASHAKHWNRPTSDSGKLLFDGIRMIACLENADAEKKWTDIMRAAGGIPINSGDVNKKGVAVDIVLVDSLSMPPHTTAAPAKLTKILNKISSQQTNTVIVDLSWATQCIVQRKRLQTDDDKRYRVDMSQAKSILSKKSAIDIFSIKVKQFDKLTRYEIGDSVNFGKRGAESYGRITSIRYDRKTRKSTAEVKVLELHNECELMDGGKSVHTVQMDTSELQGHIVILGGKDFGDVAWSGASNVFRQKKA